MAGYLGNSPDTEQFKRLADSIENLANNSAQSSQLAYDAVFAAKKSARWTMIATIVSIIATALNFAIVFKFIRLP